MLDYFNTLSKFTKSLIVSSLILLIYGYVCRIVGMYFFWESKTAGWALIFIAVIICLIERIKWKKRQAKKVLSEKIFIGLSIFIILTQSLLFFVLFNTDAYKAAKQFLLTDKNLINEVGEIKSFSIIPLGGIAMSSNITGESEAADINIIVKGNKKYKDLHLKTTKTPGTDWITEILE